MKLHPINANKLTLLVTSYRRLCDVKPRPTPPQLREHADSSEIRFITVSFSRVAMSCVNALMVCYQQLSLNSIRSFCNTKWRLVGNFENIRPSRLEFRFNVFWGNNVVRKFYGSNTFSDQLDTGNFTLHQSKAAEVFYIQCGLKSQAVMSINLTHFSLVLIVLTFNSTFNPRDWNRER